MLSRIYILYPVSVLQSRSIIKTCGDVAVELPEVQGKKETAVAAQIKLRIRISYREIICTCHTIHISSKEHDVELYFREHFRIKGIKLSMPRFAFGRPGGC